MEGWIGVDLDGTLAHHEGTAVGEIGEPIPLMVERIEDWLRNEIEVKIFTARASVPEMIPPIHEWLRKHGLPELEVTCCKDFGMVELWDDRCVPVIANTGVVGVNKRQ